MKVPDTEVGKTETIVTSEASAIHFVENLQLTIKPMSDEAEREPLEEEPQSPNEETPSQLTARKPWMDYRAVTDETSVQYELLSRASHADDGLLYIDGHLCVALGSKWGPVGSRYTFTMSDGSVVDVIKADEKQDAHTANGEGWTGTDGHAMELIIDSDLLDSEAMYTGDCSCLIPGTVESYILKT